MKSNNRFGVIAASALMALFGMLAFSCSDKSHEFSDHTAGSAGAGTTAGASANGGSGALGQGGDSGCSANQKQCASGCVAQDGCCDDAQCKTDQTCTDGVCSQCAEDCPAPSQGSGQGICKGSSCTIRCADDLTLCGDACVALQQDGKHCGACDAPCTDGLVCQDGKCGSECAAGLTICGASCADLKGDVNHCGDCDTLCSGPPSAGVAKCNDGKCAIQCDGQLELCDGKCLDTKTDLANCGKCGSACAGTCTDGLCCPQGQTNCNGSCVDLQGSAANCGTCGKTCQGGEVCSKGECATNCGAQTLCGDSCVDLATNAANCGTCGKACAAPPSNGAASCQGSQCKITCATNYAECTAGSCTNIKTDKDNCGGCGQACGGTCTNGVCCPVGQVNCNGKCVDLQTDAKNCLSCGRVCASGQLCEAGSCVLDCGADTRCGQTCADLSSDPYNCKTCGNKCAAPAANGKAVCAGAAGCDISCNAGSLECAGACCDAPPANATSACTNNKCAVQCKANYHACSPATSPCYANTDVKHCGSSCLDCTQPNANAVCNGTKCANTCLGSTLTCAGANGNPACGSWDFESGTVEGWVKDTSLPSPGGALTVSTKRAIHGTRSLAIPFDNKGGFNAGGPTILTVRVPVCGGGGNITFKGQSAITVGVYLETATGNAGYTDGWFNAWNGPNSTGAGGDWTNVVGQWQTFTYFSSSLATDIGISIRVEGGWTGTVYIDNVTAN